MSDRDRLFLGHVLSAIDLIASFTAEGQSAFLSDPKTQSAVIRQLEASAGVCVAFGSATQTSWGIGVPMPWN